QFRGVNGIGLAKFAQLKGIAELARRYYSVRMNEESALLSPEMDITAPYTPGALRGGSHVHVFSPNGELVSFTYNDHVLHERDP
ncbi:DUF3748 domain-containing protein, partial [Salmonella enterica subsp. enterica serovar Virginia]|nr:DUF3748 domain-containing protein [Salmonella enterica subsp. enterica serovar Virginia]